MVGRAAEARWGLSVVEQPNYTPESNCLDASLWEVINKELRAQEIQMRKDCGGDFYESKAQFIKRAQTIAFSLPKEQVNACLLHVKTNLQKIRKSKGWYIYG